MRASCGGGLLLKTERDGGVNSNQKRRCSAGAHADFGAAVIKTYHLMCALAPRHKDTARV